MNSQINYMPGKGKKKEHAKYNGLSVLASPALTHQASSSSRVL